MASLVPASIGHHHGFGRIFSGGCFVGEHDGVGAVEHSIGHVGGFRASGTRIVDHVLKHLGGGNDGFPQCIALVNDHLLNQRHLLQIDLDAQIPARDHDGLGCSKNAVDIVHCLMLFDFRYDGNIPPELYPNPAD